jgi:predicted Zn-dependent protease
MPRSRVGHLLVLCALAACASNPGATSSAPSPGGGSREIAIGRDVDEYLRGTRRIYEDTVLEQYLQTLGGSLAAFSARPELPWTFRILDDPGVNAFALPGGYVYVTRGMLGFVNSEAQLASVVGHEIGHVAAGHTMPKGDIDQIAAAAGLAAATLATGSPLPLAGVSGLRLMSMSHTRAQEKEADALGMQYMGAAGYDPMEMVALLGALARTFPDHTKSEWEATHPSTESRLDEAKLERVTLRTQGHRVERDSYLQRLPGLIVGFDWRKGYFNDNWLVAPAAGYQATFPSGWKYGREGGAFMAVSADYEAVIELAPSRATTADSAAHLFFLKRARADETPVHDSLNGLAVVMAPFSVLPLWEKIRGSVVFIEYHGTVYRMMGYAKNNGWNARRAVVDSALHSFKPLGEARARHSQPMRLSVLALPESTSLIALAKSRMSPVDPIALGFLNQVTPDSILPAGFLVKLIVGRPLP